MSNNFVFRKTLHEIVTCKIEPFIERIFAQCNFESVQTSLLIEELVDTFSDQENYTTFRVILQRLFKPHVALTFDQFKKEHLFKNLVNLLYQYKFTPTYSIVDEDIEEPKINKDDEVIEETHVNKIPNELLKKDSICANDTQLVGKDIINDNLNTRISYKNELVNVIEELKCENQYLKLQNDTLITGNPHAQCEIMNQQLMEELKKLETELKTKKQEEILQKQILSMYTKESSQETQTDGFSLQELETIENEEKEEFITANFEQLSDSCYGEKKYSKEYKKSILLEKEEHVEEPSIECKIQQIKEEKNKLQEENERLKKEIEIRQKLQNTEVLLDNTSTKCDHTEHNSTGTFEDLEELVGSIQNLEEENQAKDSIIEEYKSQLYELQCYLKLTRQSTSPLKSKVSSTVQECKTSKSFQEELIELEQQKSIIQDKNKSDSELLKIDTEFIKQNYNFITSTSQNTRGNSHIFEHSTTSEEDCDVSRISHWDCSQLNRNSFNVSNKEISKDAEDKEFIDILSTCGGDSNSTEKHIIYTSDLFDTTDPNIDFLPSPIRPVRNNAQELHSDSVDVVTSNSAFLKNKRELIPRQLISNVLSNSIPEETSNEKYVDDENILQDSSEKNEDLLNLHEEISNMLIQNNINLSDSAEKITNNVIDSKEQEIILKSENVNKNDITHRNKSSINSKGSVLIEELNEQILVRSEHFNSQKNSEIEDLKILDEIYNGSYREEILSEKESFPDEKENCCLNEKTPHKTADFSEGSEISREIEKVNTENQNSNKTQYSCSEHDIYKMVNVYENNTISNKTKNCPFNTETSYQTEETKKEEIGDKDEKNNVKNEMMNRTNDLNINNQEEIQGKIIKKDLKPEIIKNMENIIEIEAAFKKSNATKTNLNKAERISDERTRKDNENVDKTVNINTGETILDKTNNTIEQKEVTEYLLKKEVILDEADDTFIKQKETLRSIEKLQSFNEPEIMVKDQLTEDILSRSNTQLKTIEDSNEKFSSDTTEKNIGMDTPVQKDEILTGLKNDPSEPRADNNTKLVTENNSSHITCSVNFNQCVNVKEVIDLFESLYRKNLTDGECSGHTSCNRERKSDGDTCKNHAYRNIFNQMNDKLKEFELQSEDHRAFLQYREPNTDILLEPHHILTETLQKCLNEMNESFSQELDSCENSRDETKKNEACNILDLNDLIKDFNCLQLRGEPLTILNGVENGELKNTKDLHNYSTQNNKTEDIVNSKIVHNTEVVQHKPKKLTNSNRRSKNQYHKFNNNSENKLNLHGVTMNGEISRVTNNISQTVNKNTSLPNQTINLKNSLQENALVPSTKDIVKMSTSFENKRPPVGYVYGNKRNNIESTHFRKANKKIENNGQRSVDIFPRVENSHGLNGSLQNLSQMVNLSSSVSCMRRSITQNHDTVERFTISGSTICRFTVHLFRLFMSLVVLFTLLLAAVIWYQEQGRRQCPTCSQLLTFLGDFLATKLQHLDGPPPI